MEPTEPANQNQTRRGCRVLATGVAVVFAGFFIGLSFAFSEKSGDQMEIVGSVLIIGGLLAALIGLVLFIRESL